MRQKNSVFHTVLKHVPWHVFDRLVGAHVHMVHVEPEHRRKGVGASLVDVLKAEHRAHGRIAHGGTRRRPRDDARAAHLAG